MKLKRLVIQGFKSFKDRTTINFDDGITGIVGPNGCGKSNIVDALFWVMGEMSAKHLRGNSMKDVIFAGSSKYSPGSFAEATLVLENSEGKHIHIGNKVSSPTEISLTRKLYRNGETEYRINGNPCRLRDIQEVFMDTGAGAKSYSIIAQGEINRLVQAKPEERRSMIEDVAGITKFKMRRRDSVKKIEQTQSNLARLQDLQTEIEKNLKALEKQAEKAERARTLKDKIRRNDLVVHSHKVFELLKDYRDGKNVISEKLINISEWMLKKETLESSLHEERLVKAEKTDKIEELQKEYNEISKRLAAAEERLVYLCKSQSEKEKQLEGRQSELEELASERENRVLKLNELEDSFAELSERGAGEENFAELEDQVETLKAELSEKEDELRNITGEIEATRTELSDLENIIFKNTSKMEEYAASLGDITEEIEALEKQYSGVSNDMARERDNVRSLEEKVEILAGEESETREKSQQLSREVEELKKEVNSASKEMISTESRLSSLRELASSLEGVKEGASEFLKSDSAEGFSLVGSSLECDEQYSKAVQVLLADILDNLVRFGDDFEGLENWLKANPNTSLEMIVAQNETTFSSETKERLALMLDGEVLPLSEVVTLPSEMKDLLGPYFQGLFIASNLTLETYRKISRDIRFKAVASLDGNVVLKNEGGLYVLGSRGTDGQSGLIARNNKIKELEAQLEEQTATLNTLESRLEASEEAASSARESFELIRENHAQARADYAARKSALESKLANIESGTARLDILKNRKNEISKSRLTLMETEETYANKRDELADLVEAKTALKEELSETYMLQKEQYEELRDEFLKKQAESKTFEDRLKALESQVEDVRSQVERLDSRRDSLTVTIETLGAEIDQIAAELSELEQGNLDTAAELQDREEILNDLKDDFANLLQGMQEREDEAKSLGAQISKNDKEVAEYKAKLSQYVAEEEQIVRNIFEKYRVDLRKTLGNFLGYEESDYEELHDVSQMFFMETENGVVDIEPESYEFHRRYGQDLAECSTKLKNYKQEFSRLGEINWQAIEDYDRQKLRYNFLSEQERELKQSLDDLQLAIDHIDQKSKERFKVAFDEVSIRFQKVFPIIFGGGNAQLKLVGSPDDADCGVDIIAQPPGKKMQNINLMSGGEKAMTAVSLIFSIFLVKPSPFCLLDEVDAPLDDANVGRFNELLREMSSESQFILITHNKKTMELNDTLYGVTMQEPGISKAVSVQLH